LIPPIVALFLVYFQSRSLGNFFPNEDFSDTSRSYTGEEKKRNRDWYDIDEWRRNRYTKNCIVLDNICHSSQRWFQRPDSDAQSSRAIVLEKLFTAYTIYPKKIWIESNVNSSLTCTESSIDNHLVLHGWFSHMLGEFYMRVLLGFYQLLSGMNATQMGADTFRENTQLYLHLDEPSKTILDSHIAFTEGFRGDRPLLDFKELLHSTGCHCKKRLILCGYGERKSGNQTIIFPSGGVGSDKWHHAPLKELRNDLRRKTILNNPLVQKQIERSRKAILQTHNVSESDLQDWLIVGLARRNLRRRWRKLDFVEDYCNIRLREYKAVCVQVSVDDEYSNPLWQVIRHGALDALVGVHGAQLTEAIWMKPGALVVELLPFVPNEQRMGHWTRTTHSPTPLGVMFHNTDLNHIGYPLDRSSLPDCKFVPERALNKCYGKNPRWDDRDFVASPFIVTEAVRRFHSNETTTLCQDWQNKSASEYSFVLYNVNCRNSPNERVSPHHFYWPKKKKRRMKKKNIGE